MVVLQQVKQERYMFVPMHQCLPCKLMLILLVFLSAIARINVGYSLSVKKLCGNFSIVRTVVLICMYVYS